MEKGNLASLQGWIYLEVDWHQVGDGTAFTLLREALDVRKFRDGL